MQKRFRNQLEVLDCQEKKILVAVSGGLDSTVLLDLLIKAKCDVAVAHANFQLRETASEEDEAWVKQLANELSIPFYTRRFNTKNYATENGISIQMAARDLRYAWFDEVLQAEKYDILATAHHLNDNLETVLLNFTRGTGLQGLQGIPVQNGKIVRPLLTFSRTEIEEYATENNLKWREDASNAHDDYNRNFIRHQVVPLLKELNPSLEETFARNAKRLHSAKELANQSLQLLKKTHFLALNDQVKISKSLFATLQQPAPVLLELINEYGFNFDQCFEMTAAVNGQSGKKFYSLTHELIIDREYLIIQPLQKEWGEVLIEQGQPHAELGPLRLTIEERKSGTINSDRQQALLDRDRLHFPLHWRKWKHGDSFVPLGMQKKKKLSDFLIDNKVSLSDKERVTVIESDGEIIWAVGWRIDDRFKVTVDTKSVCSFSLGFGL